MQDSKEPLGTGTPYPLTVSDQQGHRGKSHKVLALGISRLDFDLYLHKRCSEADKDRRAPLYKRGTPSSACTTIYDIGC